MLKYPSVQKKKGKTAEILSSTGKKPVEKDVQAKTKPSTGLHQVPQASLISSASPELEQRYVLKWKEFMCFAFIWETPLFHVVNYIDIVHHWGGMVVFLGYFIFSMGVAMPIYTLLLFWGSYTKRGYINLWEMVPLLKGMAWAVSVFSITLELFNISIGGLALTYISNLFNARVPWANCNFEEATSDCYPMFPDKPYTKTCCWLNCTPEEENNILHFPAYEYLMKNYIQAPTSKADYRGLGKIQVPWVITVSLTWFIIFLLLILGFHRYRTVISTTAFTFAVIFFIPTFGLMAFKTREFPRPSFMASNFMHLFEAEFWVAILTHSLSRKVPGNYVILGSHAPINMVPNLNVFCIYGMKYVCFLFLMVLLSTSVQTVKAHYKVTDENCIPVSGLSLVFAIIPDIFTQYRIPHIPLFFYFLGVWFFGFLSALYAMNAFFESIVETLPRIYNIRIYFCAILCTVCCLINLMLLTNLYFTILETWTRVGFTIMSTILLLMFSFGVFVYSVRKYSNDYYFVHGKPLGSFWTHGPKLTLLVSFLYLTLIFSGLLHPPIHYPASTAVSVVCYLFIGITLAPILFVAVWIYLKYKNKGKAMRAITPTANWGPPNSTDKLIRSRFNPKREIRIKNEVQRCRHNCLLNSPRIKNEIKSLQKNRTRLTASLGVITSDDEL